MTVAATTTAALASVVARPRNPVMTSPALDGSRGQGLLIGLRSYQDCLLVEFGGNNTSRTELSGHLLIYDEQHCKTSLETLPYSTLPCQPLTVNNHHVSQQRRS